MTTATSSSTLFACIKCGFMVDTTDSETVVSTDILESLSTTNDPPSPNALATLTGECKAISRAISSLDSEIALLQAKLGASKRKRREHVSRMDVYKSALNPCRRLPNEILGSIFSICVKEDRSLAVDIEKVMKYSIRDRFPATLDTERTPWVLGQVCRRWRNLVLSLPDLWTAIDINWDEPPEEIIDPFIERRLSLTLQRCQDRPLFLLWNERSCRDRAVLSMLCSRTFQWKAVSILTGIKGLRLLAPYSGAFPILSTLYLDFAEEQWLELDENHPIFSVFREAPALRHVTLSGDCTIARRMSRQIPWNQITHLTVKGGWQWLGNREVMKIWRDFQILLPHLTNLRELTLQFFSFGHLENSPVRLVNLHTLHLHGRTPENAICLLKSLTLPSLRNLTLDPAWGATSAILQLLNRSACRLEKLEISGLEDDLVALLSAGQLRDVYDFCMTGTIECDSDGTLVPLTVSDAVLGVLKFLPPGRTPRPNLLPHLTELTLRGRYREWSDKDLVEMLASRRDIDRFPPRSVTRLQHARFYGSYEPCGGFVIRDADAARQLRRLIEGGLIINDGDARVLLGKTETGTSSKRRG
ncbi:hypothetical protein L218DRAFT_1082158 [Marasmius fiardii PR-910]|nr:hypothetical protein L218DRAFT_1082158 [Marasmius fiardii PR-910]